MVKQFTKPFPQEDPNNVPPIKLAIYTEHIATFGAAVSAACADFDLATTQADGLRDKLNAATQAMARGPNNTKAIRRTLAEVCHACLALIERKDGA